MQKNRLAAVGAFVIGGLLLFAVGLFLIGDRRMMFSDTFEVYAEFSRIAGLQNGAVVRVAGMNAGEVETIHLPASPSAKFRVKLRVREDLHQLIRLDSVASIQNDGLVGNKFVQVDSGSDASPEVPELGTIPSREPFDLAEVFERLNQSLDLVTTTFVEVKAGVNEALGAVSAAAVDAQALIEDVGAEVRAITASSQKVAADLQVIVTGVRQGRGSIGKFVTDDAFYERARGIAAEAERAVANLREASENAKQAIEGFRGDKGPVRGVVGDLQQSLTAARETLTDLADTSEALKRNFFFRGFFNRRGYFDLDDVSIAEYRQGALETNDRRVLRVWVKAEVLFATGPDGQERVTDDGRVRLDSAMGPFVEYPRTTPLVVEGYAEGATRDVQFVLSRTRAKLVRDYIVGRFGLDAGHVATMPLGPEAPESPANGRWEGVALAVFVPKGTR
ncbi:MAG TPA: MlaD family protein [Vicinamibacterales bacterium]|nr:MlaD family protein [Vicinamibacterales bacterium]